MKLFLFAALIAAPALADAPGPGAAPPPAAVPAVSPPAAVAPPPAPPPPLNHAGDDARADEDLAKELDSFHAQAEQMLGQVDKAAQGAPLAARKLETIQSKVLALAQDGGFLKSAEALWTSGNRTKMLEIQAGWFLFMILVKAWLQSRAKNWLKRLLIGWICWPLTWVGVSYVIPLLVLGEPFRVFTGTLWRVLVMG